MPAAIKHTKTTSSRSALLILIVANFSSRSSRYKLRREGIKVAKCTAERLMRAMGLAGIRRGKTTITTVSNPKAPCPLDKVNREFRINRPNALWVVDFTYVHTWTGFVYVAFVIDAFARRIVGWKVSRSATAGFVLDALEKANHARRPSASAVEMATLRWVDWFNNHRLFGPIGHISPTEAEANYYAAIDNLDMVA